MAVVVERARYLTRDEQEALAVRIETVAHDLRWEQWFYLADRFLVAHVAAESCAEVVSAHCVHDGPPAP